MTSPFPPPPSGLPAGLVPQNAPGQSNLQSGRLAALFGGGAGFQPSPVLQQFAQIFGTSTPQEMARSGAQPQAPTVNNQPQSALPGLPPEQAGPMQSAAPGAQNGNPAMGFPLPFQPLPPPQAQPQPQPFPQQQLPPGPPPLPGGFPPLPPEQNRFLGPVPGQPDPLPQVDPMAEALAMAQQAQAQEQELVQLFGGGGLQGTPQAPLSADAVQGQDVAEQVGGPIFRGDTSGAPGDNIIPGGPPPALPGGPPAPPPVTQPSPTQAPPPSTGPTPAPEPAPVGVGGTFDDLAGQDTGTFNSEGFVRQNGVHRSWEDSNYEAVRNAFSTNDMPAALATYIQNSGDRWVEGFWGNAFGTDGVTGNPSRLPLPSEVQYDITFSGDDVPDSVIQEVKEPGLKSMLAKWDNWSSQLLQAQQEGDSDKKVGQINDLTGKLNTLRTALAEFGINVTESGEFPGTGDNPDDVFGDDRTAQEGDPFQRQTTNFTSEPKIVTQIFGPPGQRNPQQQTAAAEFTAQISTIGAQEFNQQLGTNELVSARDAFADNPLFGRIEDQTNLIADQENLDFTGIRNQAVADSQDAFQGLTNQLGSLAARGGRSSASLAGLQSEASVDQSSNLARLLGDLKVQEQATGRQFALQNLGALQQGFGSTAGPLAQLSQQLAGALGAPVGQTFNPLSGALSGSGALLGLDLAQQQQQFAEDQAGINNILGFLGSQGGGQTTSAVGNLAGQGITGLLGLLGL